MGWVIDKVNWVRCSFKQLDDSQLYMCNVELWHSGFFFSSSVVVSTFFLYIIFIQYVHRNTQTCFSTIFIIKYLILPQPIASIYLSVNKMYIY